MDYHQSIAVTCEPAVAALAQALSAHGYRLERSFDLRRTRQTAGSDQYVVLLAYAQDAAAPPVVITVHEAAGLTHLNATVAVPGAALDGAVLAAFDEIWDCFPTD